MGLKYFQRWLAASFTLWTAYLAYALLAAPRLEPPAVRLAGELVETPVPSPQAIRPEFAALFPPGSWELDNPKIIETEQATLLLKDYLPTPDGKLNINPCTLIVRQEATAGKTPRPIVIRAPEGAVLQFDRPIDLARAEFGRVLGGRLPGEVTIVSPPTAPEADDGLRIVTRNVQLDAQRVFTPHEVDFQYGKSFGRGRDLTLMLRPKTGPGGIAAGGSVGGVSTLTLSRLDQLHLEFPGGNPLTGASGDTARPASQPATSTPLDISCSGGLLVDFEQQLLALDDRIVIERRHPTGPADTLRCSRLRIYFQRGAAAPTAALPGATAEAVSAPAGSSPAALAAAGSPASGLGLVRFVATGTPLTIEGPQTQTFVEAAKLEYLPPAQRMVLEAGGALRQVTLRHGPHEFVAAELQYEMAAPGKLGKLWASGPGRLKTVQGTAQPKPITAVWQKELRIQPQGERKVVSLVDGAVVAIEGLGRFQAGEIYLWVLEPDVPRAGALAGAAPASSANLGAATDLMPQLAIIPDQILAIRDVDIDSPRLRARTKRLEAEFFTLADSVPQPPADPLAPQPRNDNPGGGASAGGPPQPKYDLTGDEVRMTIARSAERPSIDRFTIKGGVHLEELPTAGVTGPLRLDGDTVTLSGGSSGKAQLVVVGQPARVTARGLVLQGGAIQYDQGAGRMWIVGAGEAVLPPTGELQPDKQPLVPPEPIRVTWRSGLEFNGQTITVKGDVHAENKSSTSVADMQQLEARFSQPIDLTQLRMPAREAAAPSLPGAPFPATPLPAAAGGSTPEIARLTLSGGVRLENWTLDERGQALARNILSCPQISIDRSQGELLCEGKGHLSSVRRGGLDVAGGGGAGGAAAPLPAGPPMADKLTHLRIHFERGFRGDIARREVTFAQKVEAIYTLVDDFQQEITLEQLDQQGLAALGPSGLLLTADRLRVAQMQFPGSGKPWYELEAQGNTRADGLAFTCLATRISYTTAKETLVVAGDGRNDAQIWYQQPGETRKAYQAGQELYYSPRTGDLKGVGLKVIDIQLGDRPGPPRRR